MARKEQAPAAGTAVVSWSEKLAKYASDAKSTEEGTGNFLSFKAGMMTLEGAPLPGNEISCIILASLHENALYPKYNPSQPQAPFCYAYGWGEDGEVMAPFEKVKDKRAPTCDICPNMVWGSDPEGSRGKACKQTRRLAWIKADLLKDPDKLEKAPILYAKVPVMSVANWSAYVGVLAARNLPPWAVATRMFLQPHPKSQFQVWFEPQASIKDDGILTILEAKMQAARQNIMFPYPDPAPETAPQITAQAAAKRKNFKG